MSVVETENVLRELVLCIKREHEYFNPTKNPGTHIVLICAQQ